MSATNCGAALALSVVTWTGWRWKSLVCLLVCIYLTSYINLSDLTASYMTFITFVRPSQTGSPKVGLRSCTGRAERKQKWR